MRSSTPTILLLAGALAVPLGPAEAQIRASERGSVAQTVDGTTLTLDYGRPSARGRELFGALMPWNVVWTPGANQATILEVDRRVRLEGVEVPAGRYSVWMTPRPEHWTLTLHPDPDLFHFQKPDSAADQIHVAVRPETGSHVEMLTWSFPAVSGDAAVLQMQWGTTAVPVKVAVQPSRPVALSPGERARYVGSYAFEVMPGIGWPTTATFEVVEEDGILRGRLPFPIHPGDELEFDLVPAGRDRFSAGLYRDGELFNVEPSVTFEFDLDGDRATTARIRGGEGSVFAEGSRSAG